MCIWPYGFDSETKTRLEYCYWLEGNTNWKQCRVEQWLCAIFRRPRSTSLLLVKQIKQNQKQNENILASLLLLLFFFLQTMVFLHTYMYMYMAIEYKYMYLWVHSYPITHDAFEISVLIYSCRFLCWSEQKEDGFCVLVKLTPLISPVACCSRS